MSNNQNLVSQLVSFFREPMPVLGKTELQILYNLEQKLDSVSQLLEAQTDAPSVGQPPPTLDDSATLGHLQENLEELTNQVRKLAKTQFKANTVQESQLAKFEETIEKLQNSVSQRENQLAQQQQQAIEAAQLDILKKLLPVMDSLDMAFELGRRQIKQLPIEPEFKKPLIAWLDGLRLARVRLLEVLKSQGITPIPAVGQPFDPHRHIAVATDTSNRASDGIIVSEDRRGYATSIKILREAEVVVARSDQRTAAPKEKIYE